MDDPSSTLDDAEGSSLHRSPVLPDPRRTRRLAELHARVDALVRCLVGPRVIRGAEPPSRAVPSTG